MTVRARFNVPFDPEVMKQQLLEAVRRDSRVKDSFGPAFDTLSGAETKLSTGRVDEAVQGFEAVALKAAEMRIPELEWFSWARLADVAYNVTYEPVVALRAFERLAVSARETWLSCFAYNCMATIHITRGDHDSAIRCGRQTLERVGDVSDQDAVSALSTIARHNIGEAQLKAGDLSAAAGNLARSAQEFREQRNWAGAAKSDAMLGALATAQKQPEKAVQVLERALKSFEKLKNREEVAETKKLLAVALTMLARFDEGISHLRQASALHRELGQLSFASDALTSVENLRRLRDANR